MKKIIFILVFLLSSTVFSAERTQTFQMPNFDEFLHRLPQYEYDCQFNELLPWTDNRLIEEFKNKFGMKQIPTNQSLNEKLKLLVPETLYTGILRTSVLNPALAQMILDNSFQTPIKFVCDNKAIDSGGAAMVSKKFFGKRVIHLDAIIGSLIEKGAETEYEKYKNADLLIAKRNIYHELLHHLILPSEILLHKMNVFEKAGREDVVYSCSNFAFQPPLVKKLGAPEFEQSRPIFYGYDWSDAQFIYQIFFKYVREKKELRNVPYTNKNSSSQTVSNDGDKLMRCGNPGELESYIYAYEYHQCEACARAIVEKEIVNTNNEGGNESYKYQIKFDGDPSTASKLCESAPVNHCEIK